MSTEYLRRILAGGEPTPDEWNDHLAQVHRRYGGAICGPMALLRTADGETSYERSARQMHELVPNATSILDLGCGDGLLLRKLRRRYGGDVKLTGIDLSEAEIERALALCEDATFLCADVRTVDFDAAGYDAIVSHLVLMIASQPELMLQAARRALRPGGTLLVIVQDMPHHKTLEAILAAAVAAVRKQHGAFAPVIPERAKIEDEESRRRLFADAGFSIVSEDRYEVNARLERVQITDFTERVYPLALLDEALQRDVARAVDAGVSEQVGRDGRLEVVLPLRSIIARG